MATGSVVQVEGARELRRTLRRAGDNLADLGAVHAAVSAMVAARAATLAPKRSGDLAGNIRGGKGKTSAVVRAGGARVPYAGPIHWGWPARHINAHPFMVDAAHDTEPTWTAYYLTRVQAIMDTVRGI
jgi:hypothetical protein